jgi:hypothetical protein
MAKTKRRCADLQWAHDFWGIKFQAVVQTAYLQARTALNNRLNRRHIGSVIVSMSNAHYYELEQT